MAHGSRFFDDLATHLPALIYEPERFTTISQILRYVQQQARNSMNRYERGRIQYMRGRGRRRRAAAVTEEFIDGLRSGRPTTVVEPSDDLLRSLMGGLFNTATPMTILTAQLTGDFAEPVPVRPTQAQIDAGSEVVIVGAVEGDERCTICQEVQRSSVGAQLRRLRHCGHTFHRNCIDVWFMNHVQCPVCRHDIRE